MIGLEKLASICMQLINIGEILKQVDKLTESKLLANYPEIDWKKQKVCEIFRFKNQRSSRSLNPYLEILLESLNGKMPLLLKAFFLHTLRLKCMQLN